MVTRRRIGQLQKKITSLSTQLASTQQQVAKIQEREVRKLRVKQKDAAQIASGMAPIRGVQLARFGKLVKAIAQMENEESEALLHLGVHPALKEKMKQVSQRMRVGKQPVLADYQILLAGAKVLRIKV